MGNREEELKKAGALVNEYIKANQPMISAMAEMNKIIKGEIEVEPPVLPDDLQEKVDGIIRRMMKGAAHER